MTDEHPVRTLQTVKFIALAMFLAGLLGWGTMTIPQVQANSGWLSAIVAALITASGVVVAALLAIAAVPGGETHD